MLRRVRSTRCESEDGTAAIRFPDTSSLLSEVRRPRFSGRLGRWLLPSLSSVRFVHRTISGGSDTRKLFQITSDLSVFSQWIVRSDGITVSLL